MKTYEYLDAVQKKLGTSSDNSVALAVGISRQAVSRYRSGIGHFDDEIARRVADILGMHPGIVMLDMYAERTKNAETKSLWEEISKGFLTLSVRAKSVSRYALPR